MPSEAVEAWVLSKRSKQNKVLTKKIDNILKTDLPLMACLIPRFDTVFSLPFMLFI
jgi:hypothetical protein